VGGGGEQVDEGLALVGFRSGERPGDRQAREGADKVEAQAPEEPRVRSAVAVLGPSGQVGAAGGLAGAGAFDRRRVGHPHIIGPGRGPLGEEPGEGPHQAGRGPQPLVVAR
ncbi:hypothetical protein ADL26_19230, partial [Thermoactinomyces vulgaris]